MVTFERIIEFTSNHPILISAFFLVLVLMIVNETRRRRGNGLDVNQMVRLVNDDNAQILDLRSEKEFSEGHILDAKNIDLANFDEAVEALKLKPKKPLILVCRMGTVAPAISNKFIERGFEQVFHLREGIAAWQKAKLPFHV